MDTQPDRDKRYAMAHTTITQCDKCNHLYPKRIDINSVCPNCAEARMQRKLTPKHE